MPSLDSRKSAESLDATLKTRTVESWVEPCLYVKRLLGFLVSPNSQGRNKMTNTLRWLVMNRGFGGDTNFI